MIVLKSGKKVFPEEVEYLFNQFDFIRESLVWGNQDENGDVVVSAKFVLDEQTLAEKHGLKPEDHGVQKLIDQMIRDVNAKMPSFKSIKQHVFSFQDMVKTTTLKIKRQIEIDKLKELMNKQKLRWRELTGKNLDSLAKEDSSGQKSESQNDKGTKDSEVGVQDDKKD
jgi:long-chain acyl-CoA synthetase